MNTTARGRYWTQSFPLDDFYEAFTHSGEVPLARRNLRFRLLNVPGGSLTFYTNARAFNDKDDLRRYIVENADKLVSIEVGAVYPLVGHATHIVAARLKSFGVFAKELVMDIDLNDYGALRTCPCGAEKRSCPLCVELFLFKTAVPVLRSAIEARGWTRAALNYSGNRGIHIWIYDDVVMTWDRQKRADFLEYLARPPEALLRQWCAAIYEPVWEQYFLAPNRWSEALEKEYMLPCFGLVAPVSGTTLRAKWQQLQRMPGFEQCAAHFLHKLLQPRLDREVTIDPHHLTKSPYSIHASTKYVASLMDWDQPTIELRFVE